MDIIKLDNISSDSNLKYIHSTFYKHGIICYPTDTLYGIGGDFFSKELISKIDFLKKREDKPYSIIVSDFSMLKQVVKTIPEIFYQIDPKLFPGKLTILFEAANSIDRIFLKNSTKIGIRMPNIPKLLSLIKYLDKPLVTTSINLSNQNPLNSSVEIKTHFPQIDLLIDSGKLPDSKGSTIIDITQNSLKILRIGDIDPGKILLN